VVSCANRSIPERGGGRTQTATREQQLLRVVAPLDAPFSLPHPGRGPGAPLSCSERHATSSDRRRCGAPPAQHRRVGVAPLRRSRSRAPPAAGRDGRAGAAAPAAAARGAAAGGVAAVARPHGVPGRFAAPRPAGDARRRGAAAGAPAGARAAGPRLCPRRRAPRRALRHARPLAPPAAPISPRPRGPQVQSLFCALIAGVASLPPWAWFSALLVSLAAVFFVKTDSAALTDGLVAYYGVGLWLLVGYIAASGVARRDRGAALLGRGAARAGPRSRRSALLGRRRRGWPHDSRAKRTTHTHPDTQTRAHAQTRAYTRRLHTLWTRPSHPRAPSQGLPVWHRHPGGRAARAARDRRIGVGGGASRAARSSSVCGRGGRGNGGGSGGGGGGGREGRLC
jgi:uncharacterized membrane protein YgcG